MAKIRAKGSEKYLMKLERLNKNTDGICKHAVYEGAKITADAIKTAIDNVPTHSLPPDVKYYYWSKGAQEKGAKLEGLTEQQKKGLKDGLGIATMQIEDGSWNTKIGFVGYNEVKTKKYPNGQPNAMIARSVESGKTDRQKTPFVSPTVRKIRKKAEKVMADAVKEKLDELTK